MSDPDDGMARLRAWVADDLARHAPPVTPDEILAATGLFPREILEHIADDLRRHTAAHDAHYFGHITSSSGGAGWWDDVADDGSAEVEP